MSRSRRARVTPGAAASPPAAAGPGAAVWLRGAAASGADRVATGGGRATGASPPGPDATPARPPRGRAHRWVALLYARAGSRLILICLGGMFVVTAITMLVTDAWLCRYLRLGLSDAVVLAGVAIPVGVGCVSLTAFRLRAQIAEILSWSGAGRTPERAPAAWLAVVGLPYVGLTRTLTSIGMAIVPLSVMVALVAHEPAYGVIPISVALAVSAIAGGSFILFALEFALRPMVEDIAQHLPVGFAPPPPRWALRHKAVGPLPGVTFFAALTVGAVGDAVTSAPGRLAVVLAVALGTVATASVIFMMVAHTLLDPVDDLIAATTRVGRGDITTPVPVLSGDEFGTLAHGFNTMLADLRRHEHELRGSQARIVAAADAERRRVERDLHDGAQQHLVLLKLKIGLLARTTRGDASLAGLVQELQEDIARALTELRDLAHGIYPLLLEHEGLPGALREASERAAIPTSFDAHGAGRHPPELEAAVYFCCLEALQNAAKHAGPGARATVAVTDHDGALDFTVTDTGHGFDTATATPHAGLQNMTDRIGALGGTLRVVSAPGAGTRITGTLPLDRGPGHRA